MRDYSTNRPNPTGWRAHFANAQLLRWDGPFAEARTRYCFGPLDRPVGFLALVRKPRWRRQCVPFPESHFPTDNRPLHSEDLLVRLVGSELWLRLFGHSDPERFPGYNAHRGSEA